MGVAELTRPRPFGLDDATAAELNRLLLILLADPEAPGRVAMHGRLGEPAADPGPAPEIRGRFLEATRCITRAWNCRRYEVLPPHRPVPG